MSADLAHLFWYFSIFIILVAISGIYCILATFNLVRAILGVEILIKAATLLIILSGYVTKQTAIAQSMVITLIVIEVAIMVVAGGVVLSLFRHYKTIADPKKLMNMKG
jgi:multisubunit Na+/H+ antiporter MnhC subunit